jgi:hypothetical protein
VRRARDGRLQHHDEEGCWPSAANARAAPCFGSARVALPAAAAAAAAWLLLDGLLPTYIIITTSSCLYCTLQYTMINVRTTHEIRKKGGVFPIAGEDKLYVLASQLI